MPSNNPIFTSRPSIGTARPYVPTKVADESSNLASGWLWGGGSGVGELAQGENDQGSKTRPVSIIGNHSFIQISCGGITSNIGGVGLGLKTDGTTWAWGGNLGGNLGDLSVTNRFSPVSVVGNHGFSQVYAFGGQSAGLKADGSLWMWGNNGPSDDGSLGNNTVVSRSSPTSVVGAHSFIQVAMQFGTGANGASAIALKSNGSAWTWGFNATGTIGDNTVTNRSSPVSVIGAHSFTQIASTLTTVHGLKADGTVWSWGGEAGSAFALGDNQIAAARSSPVSVVGAHAFTSIFGNHVSSSILALKADGSVWGWGNSGIQIGVNDQNARSSPSSAAGNHSFLTLLVGQTHSIGIKADGSVWAWGVNGGVFGDGTTANRSSPTSVTLTQSFARLSTGNLQTAGVRSDVFFGKLLYTAGPNGSRISQVQITALQTTVAGTIRLMMKVGSVAQLIQEVDVIATTSSATAAGFSKTVQLNLDLPPNASLHAATFNANAFSVIAFGGDY